MFAMMIFIKKYEKWTFLLLVSNSMPLWPNLSNTVTPQNPRYFQ